MTTVGILGVGRLAEFLVAGLRRGAEATPHILLSPRNADRAAALAERFGLVVAGDNAELVAASDLVLLATRPEQAAGALEGLPWRAEQTVLSVCAGVPLADLTGPAEPAPVARAMPLSAAMIGESPTCLYPDSGPARALLERLGSVIPLAGEADFETATAAAAIYGWIHALIGELTRWAADKGLEEAAARDLLSSTVRAAAGMVLAQREASFEALLAELATPGGLTELGLSRLAEAGAFNDWQAACGAVLARLREGGG